jgi:hypothetical protein
MIVSYTVFVVDLVEVDLPKLHGTSVLVESSKQSIHDL